MSDTELQFRTSTFGGFQKQDVLNYIETSNQEHREKLEAVRRELAEAEAAKAAQAEETAAAQAQTEAKEKELQALRGELAAAHKEAEERKLEISLLEEELEKAKQRLADTEARLKESEEKLAKAGPAAEAYEKVKDRTAGIELEAHCRAQAVQAEAAGIEPSADMNPILLKPTTDVGSQVIVNGTSIGNMRARDYFAYKRRLIPEILAAYERLSKEYDIIVIE